jgi:hypothetical protein
LDRRTLAAHPNKPEAQTRQGPQSLPWAQSKLRRPAGVRARCRNPERSEGAARPVLVGWGSSRKSPPKQRRLGWGTLKSLQQRKGAWVAPPAGFARRIFSGVSNYTHSRPGYSDGDMRESNGPIYVGSAFRHVAWMQFETLGLCFVLLLVARPEQRLPDPAIELFGDPERVKSSVTRASFEYLYPAAGRPRHL